MNDTLLAFVVVGVVEFVKRAFAKDLQACAIIAGAALAGALIGPQVGHTALEGLALGLTGSGLITTASYLGSK